MVVANRLSEISPDHSVLQQELWQIDAILTSGNISWTGKELREWLAEEGFIIIKAPKVE